MICCQCHGQAIVLIQGVEPYCIEHAPRCRCGAGAQYFLEGNSEFYCEDCASEQGTCHQCSGNGCQRCEFTGATPPVANEAMDLDVIDLTSVTKSGLNRMLRQKGYRK